jgi:hypothetical protein
MNALMTMSGLIPFLIFAGYLWTTKGANVLIGLTEVAPGRSEHERSTCVRNVKEDEAVVASAMFLKAIGYREVHEGTSCAQIHCMNQLMD